MTNREELSKICKKIETSLEVLKLNETIIKKAKDDREELEIHFEDFQIKFF